MSTTRVNAEWEERNNGTVQDHDAIQKDEEEATLK